MMSDWFSAIDRGTRLGQEVFIDAPRRRQREDIGLSQAMDTHAQRQKQWDQHNTLYQQGQDERDAAISFARGFTAVFNEEGLLRDDIGSYAQTRELMDTLNDRAFDRWRQERGITGTIIGGGQGGDGQVGLVFEDENGQRKGVAIGSLDEFLDDYSGYLTRSNPEIARVFGDARERKRLLELTRAADDEGMAAPGGAPSLSDAQPQQQPAPQPQQQQQPQPPQPPQPQQQQADAPQLQPGDKVPRYMRGNDQVERPGDAPPDQLVRNLGSGRTFSDGWRVLGLTERQPDGRYGVVFETPEGEVRAAATLEELQAVHMGQMTPSSLAAQDPTPPGANAPEQPSLGGWKDEREELEMREAHAKGLEEAFFGAKDLESNRRARAELDENWARVTELRGLRDASRRDSVRHESSYGVPAAATMWDRPASKPEAPSAKPEAPSAEGQTLDDLVDQQPQPQQQQQERGPSLTDAGGSNPAPAPRTAPQASRARRELADSLLMQGKINHAQREQYLRTGSWLSGESGTWQVSNGWMYNNKTGQVFRLPDAGFKSAKEELDFRRNQVKHGVEVFDAAIKHMGAEDAPPEVKAELMAAAGTMAAAQGRELSEWLETDSGRAQLKRTYDAHRRVTAAPTGWAKALPWNWGKGERHFSMTLANQIALGGHQDDIDRGIKEIEGRYHTPLHSAAKGTSLSQRQVAAYTNAMIALEHHHGRSDAVELVLNTGRKHKWDPDKITELLIQLGTPINE
jgi:hypothetical protein